MAVFNHQDYKDYLQEQVEKHKQTRGYQRIMAEAAGCQPSFLSQVLNGPIQLTPDQAAGLASFWGLSQDETEYLLSLVHLARSTSRSYKRFLSDKLKELREKHQDLSRVRKSESLDLEAQTLYYSAWYYAAIHVLAAIPEFQTVAAIARKLQLPEDLVQLAVNKLEGMGILQNTGGALEVLQKSVHLPRTSPLITQSHAIWRQYAVVHSQLMRTEDYNFTAVYAIARKDYERVRALILEFIKQISAVVAPSPEEDAYVLLLDSFRLGE